jgi:hypothetical protein
MYHSHRFFLPLPTSPKAMENDFPGDDEAEFLEASKLKVVTGKDVLLGMCPMG